MLHALTRNKSKLHERYLGHRESGEKKVSEEDEITALIMGPLAFLPSGAIGSFWKALLKDVPSNLFPDESVTDAQMTFWPRADWTRVEPDLRVDLSWESKKLTLLIEFKWRAPLSGRDQLHRQWNEYLLAHERQRALHLFIAPDISAGLAAREQDDIWGDQLILRSWFDILNVMQDGLAGPEHIQLQRWKKEVIDCLQKLSIHPLGGFQRISPPAQPVAPAEVFWKGFHGFAGMARLDPPASLVNLSDTIFFRSQGADLG
jgi:hypothetical protein